jgi:prepilin-type N-terminal cleavage/methylation domain-containing protein
MKISLPVSSPPASDTAQARAATSPRFRKPSVSRLAFRWAVSARREAGFTLTEVVVAVALITLTFAGVIYGYIRMADRAEWSSYSLAAQSLAMQGVEQARAAKWDPQAWPVVDDLGVTNFMQVEVDGSPLELNVPVAGQPIFATNYISVTTVTVNPPLRQLRADCVWMLKGRPPGIAGPFTNTAVTLRAADQ